MLEAPGSTARMSTTICLSILGSVTVKFGEPELVPCVKLPYCYNMCANKLTFFAHSTGSAALAMDVSKQSDEFVEKSDQLILRFQFHDHVCSDRVAQPNASTKGVAA